MKILTRGIISGEIDRGKTRQWLITKERELKSKSNNQMVRTERESFKIASHAFKTNLILKLRPDCGPDFSIMVHIQTSFQNLLKWKLG